MCTRVIFHPCASMHRLRGVGAGTKRGLLSSSNLPRRDVLSPSDPRRGGDGDPRLEVREKILANNTNKNAGVVFTRPTEHKGLSLSLSPSCKKSLFSRFSFAVLLRPPNLPLSLSPSPPSTSLCFLAHPFVLASRHYRRRRRAFFSFSRSLLRLFALSRSLGSFSSLALALLSQVSEYTRFITITSGRAFRSLSLASKLL